MISRLALIEELRKYPTLAEFHASAFYRRQAAELDRILHTPDERMDTRTLPKLQAFIRVTSWNIEKGKSFEGILAALQEHPVLSWSDLVLLNEVDVGMSRSRNRHVAQELAERLGMSYIFAPAHIELTRGVDSDLLIPGDNTHALQGNAILTRYPFSHPRIIDLPVCFQHFEWAEKRYGRRIALAVDLHVGHQPMTIVCTHLEVRNTPACRARQVNKILEALDSGSVGGRVLIAGDFNTNTFSRGSIWRTLQAFLRLISADPDRLRRRLLYPDTYNESLFRSLVRHGFIVDGFNDRQPTAVAPLKGVEDSRYFPRLLRPWAVRRMRRHDFRLQLRLDWMVARHMHALSEGAAQDPVAGIYSISAQTIAGLTFQGLPISDHDPIVADIAL